MNDCAFEVECDANTTPAGENQAEDCEVEAEFGTKVEEFCTLETEVYANPAEFCALKTECDTSTAQARENGVEVCALEGECVKNTKRNPADLRRLHRPGHHRGSTGSARRERKRWRRGDGTTPAHLPTPSTTEG